MDRLINNMSAATNPLIKLISQESGARHVGFTLHSSYSEMLVMTNDKWRSDADGLPMNGYLLATSLDPSNYSSSPNVDRRVVVFRIAGRTEIATDRDTVNAIMRHFQDNPEMKDPSLETMEPLSRSLLQWSGVKCNVLGTFYLDSENRMVFGADIEDFFASRQMRVLKPGAAALETVVNFVDPIRLERARQDAEELGMRRPPQHFRIGRVRFTSSSHMTNSDEDVPVRVFPGDFLSRRTAVFGMTRTGKSNTTKTTVAAVLLAALESDLPVGQLILDINGEYSNANGQDKGSLADAFSSNTVRYRAKNPKDTSDFEDLRLNFYESLDIGLSFIAANIRDDGGRLGEDLQTFVSMDLSEPNANEVGHDVYTRWSRRKSIYQAILFRSEYPPPSNLRVGIDASEDVLDTLYREAPEVFVDDESAPATNKKARADKVRDYFGFKGTSPYSAELNTVVEFWSVARDVEHKLEGYSAGDLKGIRTGKKKKWLNATEGALLNVLVGRSGKTNAPIRAANTIRDAGLQFHSPRGSDNVGRDIYRYLTDGRIVIVDLSVGPPVVRERMAESIARHIFDASAEKFTSGTNPPRVVIYVEEAHNLIGKSADLNETWPRIAKEGAKYGIALVYATQEPSSVHPNILANTENFFVTHLNNDIEIRSLAHYYDFADFSSSLKRCQDVGFARVKTLSSIFTVSTQIDKFSVEDARAKFDSACSTQSATWFKPLANRTKL